MSAVPALEASGLTKTFSGPPALAGVDLTVGAGEIHALLGENGSGKSTLIKILSGFHQPDAGGTVRVAGGELRFGSPAAAHALGARFVHQDLALVGACTIADNLTFGSAFPTRGATIRRRALFAQAREDLSALGLGDLDPGEPVATLPQSLRTGVAVARALRSDPDAPVRLLVLDEPTATLPDDDVRRLLEVVQAVAKKGVGVLYVTHRLDEVLTLAQTVTVLRDGHRVASRPATGLTRSELVGLLLGEAEGEPGAPGALAAAPTIAAHGAAPVLQIRGLDAGALTGLDLDAYPGEIIGVAGLTGSGREALLPAVYGAAERRSGTVTIGDKQVPPSCPSVALRAGAAYVPADRSAAGMLGSLCARENLTLSDLRPFWRLPSLRRAAETAEAESWFSELDVRPRDGMERALAKFSGGNQQKIVLARGLRTNPRVLLLDEPTQGVDVGAKAQLHRRLATAAAEGCAVLVASSDTDELVGLCHRVLIVRQGRVVSQLDGDALSVNGVNREVVAA